MKFSLLLLALTQQCLAAGLTCPPDGLDKLGLGTAPLFSSLPLGKSSFAVKWDKARPELAKKFPGLSFEKSENLHVTLVYMGTGWDPSKVGEMERLGLDAPNLSSGTVKFKGESEMYGDHKEVVALTLTPVPAEWSARLMKDRQTLTDEGLRKLDKYDGVFKPHVSLASAAKPDDQRAELAAFAKWMSAHASRFGKLEFPIDKTIKPEFDVVQGKAETLRFVPLHEYCASAKD